MCVEGPCAAQGLIAQQLLYFGSFKVKSSDFMQRVYGLQSSALGLVSLSSKILWQRMADVPHQWLAMVLLVNPSLCVQLPAGRCA